MEERADKSSGCGWKKSKDTSMGERLCTCWMNWEWEEVSGGRDKKSASELETPGTQSLTIFIL